MKHPRFPLPWSAVAGLTGSLLTRRPRSLGSDGQRCLEGLRKPVSVLGWEHLPETGSLLLVCNHYTRPGLPAWWMVLAVSAHLPYPIHWIISAAYTFNDHPLWKRLTPLSAWLLRRTAQTYNCTPMPPLPPFRAGFGLNGAAADRPNPLESSARAEAVRQLLRYAKANTEVAIGLAPEGRDAPGARLQAPPPGSGRFMAHLARLGRRILPVGIYEIDEHLCLHFGAPFTLELPAGLPAQELDHHAAAQVMRAIAALLPEPLQGPYSASAS